MSLEEYGQLNGLLSMSVLSCILPKLISTITERIALIGRDRALVYESIDYGNDVTCHAGQDVLFLVFRQKNIYYCKKQIDHNFPWSALL